MSIPYLSDMPAAIASTDAGEPLVIKVDALIAAMPTLVSEANAMATWAETRASNAAGFESSAAGFAAAALADEGLAAGFEGDALASKNTAQAAVTAIATAAGLPSLTSNKGKAMHINPTADDVLWAGAKAIGDTVVSTNAQEHAPPEWLECDGSSFSSGVYPELYAVLGTTTLPSIDLGGYPWTKVYIQSSF